jgi:DNA-binding HxlR family transcriptional regulator
MVELGKKWSDKILLSLRQGPKRFNEIMKNLSKESNVSSRSLADRLKDLEEQELVSREIIESRPPSTIYRITEKGEKALELIIKLNSL